MDQWDLAFWAVAGYIAVVTLARLMVYRRDRLLAEVRADRELKRQRRAQLARQRRLQEARAKARADRGNAA
ncbi:MAG: hypothetical protein HY288_00190 [Planctomycetia bacterium]|nr:hypothetical protein [Planctomycetia bacterium]